MASLVRLRGGLGACLVLATVMTVGTARGQEAPGAGSPATPAPPGGDVSKDKVKEADEHFSRGRQLFDEGDYQLALVEFNRAYELAPNYRVLFNIAQINIQLFNYAAARIAIEKFLKDGGADIPPARKAQAERDLAMLKTRTATLSVTSTPPADVTIDDASAGSAPFTQPMLVNAGARKVTVSKPGYVSQTQTVTVAGGDARALTFTLQPVPTDERPEGPKVQATLEKNYTPATIGWVTTGVLAAGAVVFGSFYLSRASDLDTYSDPASNVTPKERDEYEASATRMAVAADVFGILAVAAAGVSLYFTLKPPVRESVKLGKVRVVPGGVAGTF